MHIRSASQAEDTPSLALNVLFCVFVLNVMVMLQFVLDQ
jgi:hypothetical protein